MNMLKALGLATHHQLTALPSIWVTVRPRKLQTSMASRGGRGRGSYYREKYGGGGRGRGGRGGRGRQHGEDSMDMDRDGPERKVPASIVGNSDDLTYKLQSIDGASYGAYKELWGGWRFNHFILYMDHIQGDAYAAPSRCRVQIQQSVAGYPQALFSTKVRNIACCDYLTRRFGALVKRAGADVRMASGGWGGSKGGDIAVDQPGQHVIERSSVNITADYVDVRFTVGLPARGRSVLGELAHTILVQNLPQYVHEGMLYSQQDKDALSRHVHCCEDTEALRSQLLEKGLVGFVGNGSILPRKSGACDEPMSSKEAIPFKSPESLEIELHTPNKGPVKGMAVQKGVTLIVGGGFHGKSTLLNALEVGIYNKIPGDGRELVVSDVDAVKIRAEDGRLVECVDISPFLNNLPYGKDTVNFRSADASGSTSQAANIQEALELGATTMLVDEDTCATNFMIRDQRMQALVAKEKEPITPFISRIRSLVDVGVSTVLVIGGSGDYFEVADTVICMDAFKPKNVTAEAKRIAREIGPQNRHQTSSEAYGSVPRRAVLSVYDGGPKIAVRNSKSISFGEELLDLSGVEQLVEISQTRAISDTLQHIKSLVEGGRHRSTAVADIARHIEQQLDSQGLDAIASFRKPGNLARPRRFEIIAALNRLRSIRMHQSQT